MFTKRSCLSALLLAAAMVFSIPLVTQKVAAQGVDYIDILVVFDESHRDNNPGSNFQADAQSLIDEVNFVLQNSRIDNVRARLAGAVGVEEFVPATPGPITEPIAKDDPSPFELAMLDIWRFATQGEQAAVMDQIHAYRDVVGADVVSLIMGNDFVGPVGGIARWIRANEDQAFNISVGRYLFDQNNFLFVHELGHLLGADHDVANDTHNSPLSSEEDLSAFGDVIVEPFARGLLDPDGQWRTIMAYQVDCPVPGGCREEIPYFSNPDISQVGTPLGDESTFNNARAIREHGPVVAGFRTAPAANQCPGISASVAGHVSANRAVRYFYNYYARGSADNLGRDSSVVVSLLETSPGTWEPQDCTAQPSGATIADASVDIVNGGRITVSGRVVATGADIAGVLVSDSTPGSVPVLCKLSEPSYAFECPTLVDPQTISQVEIEAIDVNGSKSVPYVLNVDLEVSPVVSNAQFSVDGGSVSITADVYFPTGDIQGDVGFVSLIQDGTPLGGIQCDLANGEISCVLQNLASGEYVGEVVALSGNGYQSNIASVEFTVGGEPVCTGTKYESSNYSHYTAGRAYRNRLGFSYEYYARGSGDLLGRYSHTTTLRETDRGYFELGCP